MGATTNIAAALKFPSIAWSFSAKGYRRRAKSFAALPANALHGQRALVTGASSGIGVEIARGLARLGAELILLCRSEERGTALRDELVAAGAVVDLALLDLLDGDAIDRFAAPWAERRIDIVVHNAGALFDGLEHTDAGVERTAALHVLAPERLNRRLESALERSESPRIIYVASGGMYAVPLLPDEIQRPATPFDGVRAYALCKRAQLECAKRWSSHPGKICAYAMHPGWVDTPGVEQSLPAFYRRTKRWLRTPAEGADTVVWLASEAQLEIPPGAFVFDRARAKEHILPGTRAAADASRALVAWMDAAIPF